MLLALAKLLAACVALLWALLVGVLFCLQDCVIFPGSVIPMRASPVDDVATERLALADGRRFRLAVARPRGRPRAVVLWFVGNAEAHDSNRWWVDRARDSLGVVALSPEYPGYEAGTGRPSKHACLEAAELAAARAQRLAKRHGVPLFIAGHSLGTFMAVHVAARGIGDRLLLISPPVSVQKRGEEMFPFLPIRCLLMHDLDNLATAPKVRIPTLVLHGTADTICPIGDGRSVAKAIPGAKLVEIPGGDHNPALLLHEAGDRAAAFLR